MEGESTGSAANRISSRSSESFFIEREEVSGVKIGVREAKIGACVDRTGVSCVTEGVSCVTEAVSLDGIWLSRSTERISEEGESESRCEAGEFDGRGGAFRFRGWWEGSFGEEGRSGRGETGGLAGLEVRIGET